MKYVILILGAVLIFFFSSMSFSKFYNLSDEADSRFLKEAPKLSKKYDLDFLMIGSARIFDYYDLHTIFTLSMKTERAMTKEEVRELIKPLMQDFWKVLHSDPIYKERAVESWFYEKIKEEPLKPSVMGIKLSFWDEEVNRRPFPYVSLIKVMDNRIFYYHADPATQKLQEPVIETFEEIGLKFE